MCSCKPLDDDDYDDDDDDDDVRAVLAACSHLGTEKLNFVFWFFSFVSCATMMTVIEKEKKKFRRLHLPKAKAETSKVTRTKTMARYVWVVHELEPNSSKRRRQWSPHMDSLSEAVSFKNGILVLFAFDKGAREDCGLNAGIPHFEYERTIALSSRFHPRDHHLFVPASYQRNTQQT
jgi:hypothetical protein